MLTLDFETEAIEGNPTVNPPKPVGLALKEPGRPGEYMAWGHPSGNNCTWENARQFLATNWHRPMLFHNAAFDVSVACKWFDLPAPDPLNVHDTMFSLFLTNPYLAPKEMSLKPASEKLLGWPAEEQDALRAWVLANVDVAKPSQWAAHISKSPPDIAGPYAIGDVERTAALHEKFYPQLVAQGMEAAYQREQLLRPLLLESERTGIRVDLPALERDLLMYENALTDCEISLRERLNGQDIGTPDQLCDALESNGLVDRWTLTATGKRSTAKDAIASSVTDPEVVTLLRYRAVISGCLQTFMRPWAELAQADGRLHPSWNQVRSGEHKGSGARTGRLSGSRPNFMNVSNKFFIDVPTWLPDPPMLRRYLLPEEGHVWLKRDFSSQEVRIVGHFEDGALQAEYKTNPLLDPHEMARTIVRKQTGLELHRKQVKIIAFSIMYGAGLRRLSGQLGITAEEAGRLRHAYLKAMPGVEKLAGMTKRRGYRDQFIRTWGGRIYYKEPSKLIDGQMRSFEYKLLNYLIQGSAADQTKQALVDWAAEKSADAVFLAAVHDEINVSVPADAWREGMNTLQEAMDRDRMDVPFRSEGFMGPNWQKLEAVA